MIQICQGCQSLQRITCFKKNDGVTHLANPGSFEIFKMAFKMADKLYMFIFLRNYIDRTDAILVSSIGYSGSENPKNIFNSFLNYHVTLKV